MNRIPRDIVNKYGGTQDTDAQMFVTMYELPPKGSKILVVGAHDESTANMLSACDMNVIGVDLREYDKMLPECNYKYIRRDFCDMPLDFLLEHHGSFDSAVLLSCIEHFGLSTYHEGGVHKYYDVIAMRKVWEYLKVGASAYISFPAASYFIETFPHWKCYDVPSACERLVQDFELVDTRFCVSGPAIVRGRTRMVGEILTNEEVLDYHGMPPHITAMMVLKKNKVTRLAPDGR